MTNINTLTLQVDDVAAAESFYTTFGVADRLRFEPSTGPTSGFRGFVISLVVADPAVVDAFIAPAVAAGARIVKPAKKSFWGYGGVLEAPDGTLWKIAASSKKVTGAPLGVVDSMVLLIGADDIVATKDFYVGRGLSVAKSFGRKYVEFDAAGGVTLALYGRKAAAKDAGVPPEGSGSHRLVIDGSVGGFADPDGFPWRSAA